MSSMTEEQPQLRIIAGPNGSGKTTFVRKFLPRYAEVRNFVNADMIAAGLSPFAPETVAVTAGRLMLTEIRRLIDQRATFAFETTLSGRTFEPILRQCRDQG
jgi:predicted ABC-type ATPase